MNSLRRERYEVPLVLLEGKLFLDVMCHADKVLLVNVVYNDTTQAVYYPPTDSEIPCEEAERACRMALGHFRSKSFGLYMNDRRAVLRRSALILDAEGPLYDGILFKHEIHQESAAKGPSLSAS
ncbi:hypothetical protein [Pseudomonas sp. F(2018)]|uniref:hypothetical protein n=1 Tax=Pseudomonas sp. F(2018) TaxID=2502240 RepID=UPI0010F880D4|nr:hypothetical protein [Pseudomonas sp. F(2018)]